MGEAADRLAAYWYSLRYQRPWQLAGRLRYWVAWKLYPRFPSMVAAWCRRGSRSCRPRPDFAWHASEPSSCHLGDNRFRFLNQTVDFGERIDWNPQARSLLWRFHLHYFDWAPGCDKTVLAQHVKSWIQTNPPGSWPGWHPYPTSLRIVNWIRAMGSGIAPPAAASLAAQAAFLERNLEFHLGANHLLENAWALLAAGLYFEGPTAARWKTRGLDLLRRQLDEQVLADGGHFERSPFYHQRVTRLVSDAVNLLANRGLEAPPEISNAAQRLIVYSQALRHQDGSLPLFHDGLDAAPDRLPPTPGSHSFPASGYYVLEGRHGRLIADYGAPGACYNPGHQHAGIFSFEISTGGQKVIVDSGTDTYDPGPRRTRLRCTAAHNTVVIDGQDQFQVWGTFRVGRRAWVSAVEESRGPHFHTLTASHDGYRRHGLLHRRSIVSVQDLGWLIVDDVSGSGSHRLESFLHLSPGVHPVLDGGRICLTPLGWSVLPFGLFPGEIIPDTHSPAAGVSEPSQAVVFRQQANLPCRFGYFVGPATCQQLHWDGQYGLRLETAGGTVAVRLVPHGPDWVEVGYN